jgi:transposase
MMMTHAVASPPSPRNHHYDSLSAHTVAASISPSCDDAAPLTTRLPYAPEFRHQMVALVRAGRTPEELATEFEPTAQSIRNWVAQSERNDGRGDGGLTTAEREELNRLRRENRQLRVEREILSKAAAWFARETNAIPAKGSGS